MKSDIELLHFVVEQILQLEGYIADETEESFLVNDMLYDACTMKILVISEYSIKVTRGFKAVHKEIEWPLIQAARNVYAHDYGDLVPKRVWKTITEDIPLLKSAIERIIGETDNNKNATN